MFPWVRQDSSCLAAFELRSAFSCLWTWAETVALPRLQACWPLAWTHTSALPSLPPACCLQNLGLVSLHNCVCVIPYNKHHTCTCIYMCLCTHIFFNPMYIDLRKREMERGREREKNNVRAKHRSVASYTCPDQGSNPSLLMCPDQESNLQPFGVQDDAPTNWATSRALYISCWSYFSGEPWLTQDLWNLIHSRSNYSYKVSVYDSFGLICSFVHVHTRAGFREHRQVSDSKLLRGWWVLESPMQHVARGHPSPPARPNPGSSTPCTSLRKPLQSPSGRSWPCGKDRDLQAEAHTWPWAQQQPLNPVLVTRKESALAKRVCFQSELAPILVNQINVNAVWNFAFKGAPLGMLFVAGTNGLKSHKETPD